VCQGGTHGGERADEKAYENYGEVGIHSQGSGENIKTRNPGKKDKKGARKPRKAHMEEPRGKTKRPH